MFLVLIYPMKTDRMIIDDKTGKISGPFTDDELVERYSEQPPATDDKQEQLISAALDNAITALGQVQKGTARQFLRSAIEAALKAEREKAQETAREWFNRNIDKERNELRQQLLAAQAAIAEASKELNKIIFDETSSLAIVNRILGNVDLSALERHDAEVERKFEQRCERGLCKGAALFAKAGKEHDDKVRKPLVDALKLLSDDGPLVNYRAIARCALDKVQAG